MEELEEVAKIEDKAFRCRAGGLDLAAEQSMADKSDLVNIAVNASKQEVDASKGMNSTYTLASARGSYDSRGR